MSFHSYVESHLQVITLGVATIALLIGIAGIVERSFRELFPCTSDIVMEEEVHHGPGMGGGMAHHGGPGMAGQHGPMMAPGMAVPGGMRGAPREVNPELLKALEQRVSLLRTRLDQVTADFNGGKGVPQAEVWNARYAYDEAVLAMKRAGGRRMMPGASEAFLKKMLTARIAKAAAPELTPQVMNALLLSENQAEIAWLTASARIRNREAFDVAAAGLADYPEKVTDEQVDALFAAEQAR